MKCPLSKLNNSPGTTCDEDNCGVWDKKKDQCGILSYMQAYFAMGLATLKLSEATTRLNAEEEEEGE